MNIKIHVPGYYRVQPNFTKDDKQVVLLSLNGRTAISTILRSELQIDDTVVTDYDGELSIGQELFLFMSETGSVKATRVIKEDFDNTIVADFKELGNEALGVIRRYDLAEHGGIIRIENLEDEIQEAGGRGYFTMSMIKTIQRKTPDLSVSEHIIWQYYLSEGAVMCLAYIPSSIQRVRFFSENLFNPMYNTTTPHVFFKEHVGKSYQKGITGHRVLVLGESLFCDKVKCPFFPACTNTKVRNSSAFEEKCPNSDVPLSESVQYNVDNFQKGTSEGDITSYANFTKLMEDIGAVSGKENLYESIVFYDFMQFFSPQRSISSEYLSERDDIAFEEIVHKHNPDIIIIWGTTVANRIKKRGRYQPRNIKGGYDLDYIFNQKIDGRWRSFFCIYHPSDSHGYLSDSWEKHVEQGKLIFV